MSLIAPAIRRLEEGGAVTLARAPEGYDAFVVAELTRALAKDGEQRAVTLAFVARDGLRAQAFIDALSFAAPEIEVADLAGLGLPALRPRLAQRRHRRRERMTALARLARARGAVGAAAHSRRHGQCADAARAAARLHRGRAASPPRPATACRMDDLARWLEANGYMRASTVRDIGDYASRGGILDLYPPGLPTPIRLDFFGDTLESIRAFDPETQRSTAQLRSLDLVPMSEAQLTTETIRRFRQGYAREFGAPRPATIFTTPSAKAAARSASSIGCRCSTTSSTRMFDYVGGAPFVLDARAEDAAHERIALIADNYAARRAAYAEDPGKADYKPLPPHAALSQRRRVEGAARRAAAGAAHAIRGAAGRSATSSIAAAGQGAISPPSGRTRAPTCSTPRSRMCGRCASAA